MVLAKDLQAIGNALADLMDQAIHGHSDLAIWYAGADAIRRKIVANPELSDAIPSPVWHYLSDADTRHRDSRYAEIQNKSMRDIVLELKRGRIP